MSGPSSSSSAQRPSALSEVLNNWRTAVLNGNDDDYNDDIASTIKSYTNLDLQQDAQTFFRYISSNTQIDTGSGLVLQTKSSHEEALARLVQELGPAFAASSTHPKRLRGLQLLLGALEGCRESSMSKGCCKLLGDFLLLQCGPIVDDDEYEEDYDTLIRDTCVTALSALSETSAATTSIEDYVEALEQRSHYSVRGVERRCAAPDDDDDDDRVDPYGDDAPVQRDIRGGLSVLPRSKRSLCFDLLCSAVTGISKINLQIQSTNQQQQQMSEEMRSRIQRHLVQFTEFSTRCIPGESDPRCLMQLFELLHSIQVTFEAWFVQVESSANVFPHEDVFESVVPYYPIQFTPPPNNIHGITREGLHSELIAVLTCTKMDAAARKYRKPTMLGCSIGLFLDQLLPAHPDEELPPTSLEKLETLECMETLLFHGKRKQTSATPSECGNLTVDEVRSLSQAIRTTHDEASLAVGSGKSPDDANKVLADACRSFVSRVASELEKRNSHGLWKAFVSEPLDKERRKLQVSPSRATTTIAYEACLCASGGPKTLRASLAKGLEPLINFLKDNFEESDDSLAAVRGMSAFFSSTNVALTRNREEGVELTPHPMDPYSMKACDILLKVVENNGESLPLKTVASTALDCLFLVGTTQQLDSEDCVERICSFLKGLLRDVTSRESAEADGERLKYQSTASHVLGSIIGFAMGSKESESLNSILVSPKIREYVERDVFPALKDSVFAASTGVIERYDRRAMAMACSDNFELASSIVKAHVAAFVDALNQSLTSPITFSTLEALSYLIRNSKGNNVVRAFHEDPSVDGILDALGSKLTAETSARLRASIAQIALPATTEERDLLMSRVKAVQKIESKLRPAYSNSVPIGRLEKLLRRVSNKTPPLSKADEGDLFVRLPILAAAVQSTSSDGLKAVLFDEDGNEKLAVLDLLKGLVSYSLSAEHLSTARVAAASCVHGLLRNGFEAASACPVKPLVASVADALDASTDDVGTTENCLSFLSLLGQAGAIRGSSSSSTADAIAKFLVEIACEDKASIPYDPRGRTMSTKSKGPFERVSLQIAAASGYGALLVVDGMKPLMKQRLSHASLKFIKKIFDSESVQARQNEPVSAPSVGQLLVVCHFVCASDLSKFDRKTTHIAATVAVEGLSSDLFQVGTKISDSAKMARTLVVCAILKLICTAPAAVNGFVLSMVAGLLRAYAVSNPDSEIGCKVVVLQALEELSHLDGAKATISAVKPAVLSILESAMTQKSGLLRSTAVDVRNAWCLVD